MTGRHLGSLLVALQFALLAALAVVAAPAFAAAQAGALSWALLGLAAALGAWALASNRPGNFNVHPSPRAGGQLVQSGPYRWIRHPMYTSVLSAGAGAAAAAGGTPAWLGVLLLVVVLGVKAALEERWMIQVHPGYADYRRRSHRFVPGLY